MHSGSAVRLHVYSEEYIQQQLAADSAPLLTHRFRLDYSYITNPLLQQEQLRL